jgi:hypothetical protein
MVNGNHFSYGQIIIYSVIFFKLIRLDTLSGKMSLSIIFMLYLFFPLIIIFAFIKYIFNLNNGLNAFISLSLASLVVIYIGKENNTKISEEINITVNQIINWFRLQAKIDVFENNKSQIEMLNELNSKLEEESGNKIFYIFGLIAFLSLLHSDFKDIYSNYYYFIEFQLNVFTKYIFLILVAGVTAYVYGKYYDFFCSKIYASIVMLVRFSELDKKYIFFIKENKRYPYFELIEKKLIEQNIIINTKNKLEIIRFNEDKYGFLISSNLSYKEFIKIKNTLI